MKEITVDGKTYFAVPKIALCTGCVGQHGTAQSFCWKLPECTNEGIIFIKPEKLSEYIVLRLMK